MGLFSKISDTFHWFRPGKSIKTILEPRKRLIPRINMKTDFQKCDKCGRSFLKTQLKHVDDINEDLCEHCHRLFLIYRGGEDS